MTHHSLPPKSGLVHQRMLPPPVLHHWLPLKSALIHRIRVICGLRAFGPFPLFLHAFLVERPEDGSAHAYNGEADDLSALLIVPQNQSFAQVDPNRRTGLAEAQVEHVRLLIIFPIDFLSLWKNSYRFHKTFLQTAGRFVR